MKVTKSGTSNQMVFLIIIIESINLTFSCMKRHSRLMSKSIILQVNCKMLRLIVLSIIIHLGNQLQGSNTIHHSYIYPKIATKSLSEIKFGRTRLTLIIKNINQNLLFIRKMFTDATINLAGKNLKRVLWQQILQG